MIKAMVLILSMFAATVYGVSAKKADEATQQELKAIAISVIENIEKGEFAEVTKLFDSNVKNVLSAKQLKGVWENALPSTLGKYISHKNAVYSVEKGYDVVKIDCKFENAPAIMIVAFDKDKKIAGLNFVPDKR